MKDGAALSLFLRTNILFFRSLLKGFLRKISRDIDFTSTNFGLANFGCDWELHYCSTFVIDC